MQKRCNYYIAWLKANATKQSEGTGADKIVKRVLRRPLLNAFDIYKSNIYYGVITETEEEHNEIIKWYNSLLNLEVDAIENPPEKIIKYM